MNPNAQCGACRRSFEAPRDRIGGMMPCPGCGKAVEVPGLRDPIYRLAQVGVVLAILAVAVGVGLAATPTMGIAVGAGALGLALLVRLAL